jgi:glycosyltransferase involved in cell wall biosynthesis
MRLAWFTPLPPLRSGIAAYSAEVLPLVAATHQIDVFLDTPVPDASGQLAWAAQQGWAIPPRPGSVTASDLDHSAPLRARTAHDFLPLHDRRPYDLIVYQLGNAACHDFVWPYAMRCPGLLVLHDGSVHHARARALLDRQRVDDYRAEFLTNHPQADPLLAEHAVVGASGHHYYRWPMRGLIVGASRAVAVHGLALASELQRECPDAAVVRIHMGVASPRPVEPADRQPGRLVFAAFGLATSEKRLPLALETFAATFGGSPDVHFVIVGAAPRHFDPLAEARRLGVETQVTVTGYVDDADLDRWLRRADVCLCLRWPTTGETSASWMRCLAAGKPTVVTGLAQNLEVTSIDARTGTVVGGQAPICVSVDLVDEREALCQAYRRLAFDADLRRHLGQRAAAHWAAHHTLPHMASDYERAFVVAVGRPAVRMPGLPSHFHDDAGSLARRIAGHVGVDVDVLGSRRAP